MNNDETDTIFLDFAKAFDKVDGEILLKKLKNIGISGSVYTWIKDFLSDRYQSVVVDGSSSYIALVLSGVIQVTVLGTLLFLIYINDIEDVLTESILGCFADDSRISRVISTIPDSLSLQNDLNNLSKWAKCNNMKMHDDKFVYVNFNNRSHRCIMTQLPFYYENLQYSTTNNTILEPTKTVRDLGITFAHDLSWSSLYHS